MNLEHEITIALNRASAENRSNTPDHVLAEFLINCLAAWNVGVKAREQWYKRDVKYVWAWKWVVREPEGHLSVTSDYYRPERVGMMYSDVVGRIESERIQVPETV